MKQKKTGSGNASELGSKYVTFYACKKKFICTLLFFVKGTKTFLSREIKNDLSLIRVLAISCILALNTCDGVAQESIQKFYTVL